MDIQGDYWGFRFVGCIPARLNPLAGPKNIKTFAGPPPSTQQTTRNHLHFLASDEVHGVLWVMGDEALTYVNAMSGSAGPSIDLNILGIRSVKAFAVDPVSRSLLVGHGSGVSRASLGDSHLSFLPLSRGVDAIGVPPLVLETVLALSSPQAGLVTGGRMANLSTLGVSSLRALLFAATLLISLALPVYATVDRPIEGTVIDTSTGKPVPNAFVIAELSYRASTIHTVRTTCVSVIVLQSDADGRYRLDLTKVPGASSLDRVVFTYKAGFERDLARPYDERVIALKPLSANPRDRVSSFVTYDSLMTCGPPEQAAAMLKPLYAAIDAELEEIERTNPNLPKTRSFGAALKDQEDTLEGMRRLEAEKVRASK